MSDAPFLAYPPPTGGGAPVGGSGTAGTLPIWVNPTTLGNSAIVQAAGAIAAISITNAGAGATNGTYSQQALTGGSGTGATADIVVAGNVVTVLVLRAPGVNYANGDVLSCGTIGGAGFQFTVTSVVASDNATGNVTAQRIGAGTSFPESTLDAIGVLSVRKSGLFSYSFAGSPSPIYTGAAIDSSAESGGKSQLPAASAVGTGLILSTRYDASARSSSCSVYGIATFPSLEVPPISASAGIYGMLAQPMFVGTAVTGKSLSSCTGVSASTYINTGTGGGNTIASVNGFLSGMNCASSVAETITSAAWFAATNASFSNAAHVITSFYGLRLGTPTLAGGTTITNRWTGVSQEDALGKSRFFGNVGVGNALDVGAGKIIASLTLTNGGTGYTNGTYSQVALTGGSGTGATADIVVAGGIVTSVVLRNPGQGYAQLDSLSCASIGAGSNFAVQVASVASILRSDGDVVAPRIGAGNTSPRATFEASGLFYNPASGAIVVSNRSFGTLNVRANIASVSDGEASTAMVLKDTDDLATGIWSTQTFDFSSLTSGKNAYGGFFRAFISNATAGIEMPLFGGYFQASAIDSTVTGKRFSQYGVSANLFIGGSVGANTVPLLRVFAGTSAVVASAIQTITTYEQINPGAPTLAGAAHTVTNFYGLRLQAASLSGGATITNRWGISQEDAAANNVLAGATVIGAAAGTVPTAPLDVRGNGTVTGNLSFNSGYGSAAVAYGCRAWVYFNGTGVVAIQASGNVSSITDNAVGDYTVNFTTAMSSANYGISTTVGHPTGTPTNAVVAPVNTARGVPTAALFHIYTLNASFATTDANYIYASVIR